MIKIITDSTCDISKEEAKALGIEIIPLTIHFGNEEYLDGINITHDEFYSKLESVSELPSTSQASPLVFAEKFRACVAAGDSVLGIFISSDLSGTFQSACIGAEDVRDEYPEAIINLVDSRNVSIGSSVIIREAVKLRNANMDIDSIANACSRLAKRVKVIAVVDSLKYLQKGGRLSGSAAFIGTMLHINPVIAVADGKINVIGKVRGKKAADKFMIENILKEGITTEYSFIYGHVHSENMLTSFMDKTTSMVCPESVLTSSIGCVVGTHLGPGTIGVAFVASAEEGCNADFSIIEKTA